MKTKDFDTESLGQDSVDNLLNSISDIVFHEYDQKKTIIYSKNDIDPIPLSSFSEKDIKILKTIFKVIKEKERGNPEKSDFQIVFYDHYIRLSSLQSISGKIYNCRNMPKEFILLEDAGFPDYIIKELLHERLNKGGLVFISGAPGQGKSNTAAAFIDSRLKNFKGVFIAIEDPVEIPLHGTHGKGQCIQVPVEDTFANCIKRSLRSYPAGQNCGLFIGELRDYESAIAAVQGAIDGRLVVTTFHTKSLELAFERLSNLLSQKLTKEESFNLIAESFKLGIHQRLVKTTNPNGKTDLRLRPQILVDSQEVYQFIRQEKISGILDQIERQYTQYKNKNKITYR